MLKLPCKLPADVVNVKVLPPNSEVLLPLASFSWMLIVDVLVPSAVMLVGSAVTVLLAKVATPAVPVAVNVSGEPVSEPLVAVMVFDPAVLPIVQLPSDATPKASVLRLMDVSAVPLEAAN